MGILITGGTSTNTTDVFAKGKETQSIYMRGIKVWEKMKHFNALFTLDPVIEDTSHTINMTTVDGSDYEVQLLDADDNILSANTYSSGVDTAVLIKVNTNKINIVGDFTSIIYGSINDGNITITGVNVPDMPSLTKLYGEIFENGDLYEIQMKTLQSFSLGKNSITNMDWFFVMNTSITEIKKLYTTKVTSMIGTFTYCISLAEIPNIDTSNVTDMSSIFQGCMAITTIPLLDTSKVTDMKSMFAECNKLESIPLLDTSNVTNMEAMFNGCSSLITIPLLDTSKVIDMNHMFFKCTSLINIPLLDTSNVTDMEALFAWCSSLSDIPLLDISNITSMYYMFDSCTSLTTIPKLNTSNIKKMNSVFSRCTSLITVPELDMSNVTNMEYMFYECSSLTTTQIFDLSNKILKGHMFEGCSKLSGETTITKDIGILGNYAMIFYKCSTDPEARFVINYIDDNTKAMAEELIATKSDNSNVVLGTLVIA